MPVRVSASLIVRDEEGFLEGCLKSIVAHVDEIIVVDTGSIDRTVEIATAFKAKVLHRTWRDDFAWARNEGLNAATGDWILYIDADERLSVPDGADLRDGLAVADVFASRVLFRPSVNATPFREYRLFRNDPQLRFKGSMHETMLPDLDALELAIGARVVESPAEIVHLGYEAGSDWKHERNLPLLRAAIADNPDRLYYWYHLAETLDELGQIDEAVAIGAEGLRRARASRQLEGDNAIAAMIAATYASLLHRKAQDALPAIAEGFAHYPRNPSLQFLKARILLDIGRAEEAIPILKSLTKINSARYQDVRLAHDRRIFDVYAHDLLGVALLRLGRRPEAAACFARAAAAAPDERSYRVKAQALGML